MLELRIASATFRPRAERRTNEVARQILTVTARRHSAQSLVYLCRTVAAVHDNGLVAAQLPDILHKCRHEFQVSRHGRTRVLSSSRSSSTSERVISSRAKWEVRLNVYTLHTRVHLVIGVLFMRPTVCTVRVDVLHPRHGTPLTNRETAQDSRRKFHTRIG